MAGQRQPIELVKAKGLKHLTKNEIEERQKQEIKPITDNIIAPEYLTKKQKENFYTIANQLIKLKIMGETDVDALARYITANDFYINAVKKLRTKAVQNDAILFDAWSKIQERYFKQCRSAANDLGLSISSRCRLVVPEAQTDKQKENKFKRFEKRSVVGE
jgi:P27 family predicted phage terminase small subunit